MRSPAETDNARPDRWDWALPRLNALLGSRRPRRVLLLSRDGRTLPLDNHDGLLLVTAGEAPGADVHCRPGDLPFTGRSFDLLIVLDLLADEEDPLFDELLRVLDAGGRLVMLGPGPCCNRSRRAGAPALRTGRLCRTLRQREFVIEQRLGHGLLGRELTTGEGWKAPLFVISDRVLVTARHNGLDPVVRPLRFARPQAIGARSAVLDGLNREAAA